MLTFRIDASAPRAMFDGIAKRASAPAPILKRWGGYLKHKAHQRADAQEGWPGWSEAYKLKLESTRTSKVTAWGGVRASYAANLTGYLKGQEKKGSATAAPDLAELRRLIAGGRVERDSRGKPAAWSGSKSIDRLRKGLARAEAQRSKGKRASVGGDRRKADRAKMLGKVARQIVWDVEGNRVKAESRVPWSDVHNKGGAVGNGASVPERAFLYIEPGDLAEMNKIAVQHLMGEGRK